MNRTGQGLDIPVLEGGAAAAVRHRGGHVQIIAAAGSGKTEVVSQQVASLLADGEDPSSIVAFTFTDRAAEELKERIRLRAVAFLGDSATDKLGQLLVGTIHAFCFRLLQTYVPKYETYTPRDSNQLANLLYRENYRIGLKQLDPARGCSAPSRLSRRASTSSRTNSWASAAATSSSTSLWRTTVLFWPVTSPFGSDGMGVP